MTTLQFEQGNLKDIRIAIQNKLNELKELLCTHSKKMLIL